MSWLSVNIVNPNLEDFVLIDIVFTCIFYDADPAKSFPLREGSRKVTQQLGEVMERFVVPEAELTDGGLLHAAIDLLHKNHSTLGIYGKHMIHQLSKSKLGNKDIIWSQILPTAGGMVANQGQLFAQVLDFYLQEENASHMKEISRLARLNTEDADGKLLRYFMEGARLRSTVGLYRKSTIETTITDGEKSIPIKKGETLLCDIVTASQDPVAFPDPEQVKLDRDMDSYLHFGWGRHMCLGFGITKLALTTMLKTVARLDNLRRAPGSQGEIKKVSGPGGITMYMTADESSFWPYPATMKVRWDGDIPVALK